MTPPMDIRVGFGDANTIARLPSQCPRGSRAQDGTRDQNRELIEHLNMLLINRDVIVSMFPGH